MRLAVAEDQYRSFAGDAVLLAVLQFVDDEIAVSTATVLAENCLNAFGETEKVDGT